MKQTRRTFNWLVASALALVMVTGLAAQGAKERTGKVVRLKGAARYSTGNNVWQPLKIGTMLRTGDLVQTAAKSYVDVVLGDASLTPSRAVAAAPPSSFQPKAEQDVIRIKEDSVLAFEKLAMTDTGGEEVTETQLDLRSGKIFGTVKKMTPTSRYEIKLPNAVAGIRGTIYTISADGVIQVLTGSVVISWVAADGTPMTQTVGGGYQFDVRTGLITPIPEALNTEMVRDFRASRVAPSSLPKTIVQDKTVYYVSPTKPSSGSGQ